MGSIPNQPQNQVVYAYQVLGVQLQENVPTKYNFWLLGPVMNTGRGVT